jgi:hypothetical protein
MIRESVDVLATMGWPGLERRQERNPRAGGRRTPACIRRVIPLSPGLSCGPAPATRRLNSCEFSDRVEGCRR